jgi:hypothetical protein
MCFCICIHLFYLELLFEKNLSMEKNVQKVDTDFGTKRKVFGHLFRNRECNFDFPKPES